MQRVHAKPSPASVSHFTRYPASIFLQLYLVTLYKYSDPVNRVVATRTSLSEHSMKRISIGPPGSSPLCIVSNFRCESRVNNRATGDAARGIITAPTRNAVRHRSNLRAEALLSENSAVLNELCIGTHLTLLCGVL